MNAFQPETLIERQFAAISAIPRLSEYEQAVSDYVVSEAKRLGLRHRQDDLGNVVVWKPGSGNAADAAPVMLQAHLDMVGVCAPGVQHDFTRDPLRLAVDEKNHIVAEGTTLGADDGYGVAYLLAAMEENFVHPPLELVFTVQEENGCYGAQGLDCGDLRSRRMIGLDVMGADSEAVCTVSCYCSDRLTIRRRFVEEAADGTALRIHLEGIVPLRTGALVHPEQGNAIKLLARLLARLTAEQCPFRLAEYTGGEAENYNPVACDMVLMTAEPDLCEALMRDELRLAENEIQDGTQRLQLRVAAAGASSALSTADSLRLARLIDLLPSGTVAIHPRNGQMLATNNVGVIQLRHAQMELVMSDRARDAAARNGVNRRVQALCDLLGFDLEVNERYAPWPYQADSPLLRQTASLMREQLGEEMRETVCPGGLELCDLLPKMPGLDCVMFAPIGGECHAPTEWLDRASFNRMYAFLKTLLGRLAR